MNEDLRHSSAHVFVADLGAPSLSDEDVHHLSRVLRLRDGESVSASDGAGRWRMCEWRNGSLDVAGPVHEEPAPEHRLTIALSPVKGDRTDFVVEKLVEIGIDRILVLAPVARSVVRWDETKARAAMERYVRIARAAAMQSRRVHLPEVLGPVAFDDAFEGGAAGIAEPGGPRRPEDVFTLVVGPEGGFAPEELERASSLGARRVDLGGTILRAETAALVAAARMVARRAR